jgi:hypothetical protein
MSITIVNLPAVSPLSDSLPEVAVSDISLSQIAAQDILK